tara:strand:- start:4313 stop:4627 length:315 start_codon:yes stop_codon:yes gene_type:complete
MYLEKTLIDLILYRDIILKNNNKSWRIRVMDKSFVLFIVLTAAFWGYLKYYHTGSGSWIAQSDHYVSEDGNKNEIGVFQSYDECVSAVKEKININTVPYSCSRD